MTDGVKVGDGYIEIHPEIDESALIAKRAEIEAAMAASYDKVNKDALRKTQQRIQQQIAFEKVGNNTAVQAAVALEKQRQSAAVATEAAKQKAQEKTFQDGLAALEFRKKAESQAAKEAQDGHEQTATVYRRTAQEMTATFEAEGQKRRKIIQREIDDAAQQAKQSSGGGGNFLTQLGGPQVINFLQGAGAVLVLGQITPVLGAVLGLASAFAIAGTAAGAFGLAAAGQISQVSQAMKLVSQDKVPLTDLPADFQRIIPAVKQFKASWGQFLAQTRSPIFDVFIGAMGVAQDGLKRLVPVVNAAAVGFGNAISIIDNWVKGPAVGNFLSVVAQYAPKALSSLASSATNLGTGLANILAGFAPAGQSMLNTIQRLTQEFAQWSAQVTQTQGFKDFLGYAQEYGPKVVETLVNIGVAVGKIVIALAPLAAVFTDVLQVVSALLAAMPPVVWQAIAAAVFTIWVAFKGFVILQSVAAGIKTLATAWGTVSLIMGYATASAVALRVALIALTAATVVGLVVTAIVLGLSALADHANKAAAATRGLTADEQALAEAYRQSNGVIDDNVRKTAADALESKGLLAAGLKVGITPSQMVADYLAGGQQWADVINKLTDAENAAWGKFYAAQADGKPSGALKANATAMGDSRKAAEALGGGSERVASSNQRVAAALGASAQAAQLATTMFQNYTAAKNAALGTDTPEGQVAQDVSKAYNTLQQSLRSVTEARYNESQAAKQAADANAQSAQQVKDSLYSEVQARDAVKKAVQDLSQARADAVKAIRDQADTEESAKIGLEKAQNAAAALGLYHGPLTSDADINKQETLLQLTQAQQAYGDAQKQSAVLAKEGIDGQPGVVNAKKALSDALHSQAQAEQAVTATLKSQADAYANGQHAVAQAHQATLDATSAAKDAKTAYDASTLALDSSSGAAQVATDKMKGLRSELGQSLSMDTGDAQRQLSDVMKYIAAVKLLAANPNMTWQQAWAAAGQAPTPVNLQQSIGNRNQRNIDKRGGLSFATGGYTGDGGKYQTAGVVHAGEYVIPKETVDYLGPDYFQRYMPGYAGGGLVVPTSGLGPAWPLTNAGIVQQSLAGLGFGGADLPGGGGSAVSGVQAWLRSIANDPYTLGGVGPNTFDCSGLVGDVWAKLTGHADYQRYFVTGGEEAFLRSAGFLPGTGTFTVGFSNEHTVGNLGGLPFEAANPIDGLHIGAGATPVTSMPNVYYLPQLGSRFVGSGGNVAHLPGLYGFHGGDYIVPQPPGSTTTGGDAGLPGSVDAWIARAAQYTNIPASWTAGIKTIISRESGGNPSAINLSDSNAAAGDPSKGLMQVIHSTFEQYRNRSLPDNQFDPVANIVAAVNYIRSRYGSIFAVQQANPNLPPRGYKNGGVMMPGDLGLNETREPEYVFNRDQLAQLGGGDSPCVHVYIGNEEFKGYIRAEVDDSNNSLALSLRGGHGRKG